MEDSEPKVGAGQSPAPSGVRLRGGGSTAPGWLERIEPVLIVLIVLHSCVIGALLLFATRFSLRFAGWDEIPPLFFPRQAGVFHFVVAAGYLAEYLRCRGVTLLLIAKCTAFCFLLAMTLLGPVPWAVSFSGALDGVMAATVYLVHRRMAGGLPGADCSRGSDRIGGWMRRRGA